MNQSIRKQVYDLTAHDFEFSSCWEYASDEEGNSNQDECTVRPLDIRALPSTNHQIFVQAIFVFPNGRARLGMVTLNAGNDISAHQPGMFTSNGLLNFYVGASQPNSDQISEFLSVLKQVCSTPLPVRYVTVLHKDDGKPLASGLLTGLYWLADLKTEEIRVAI